ncbi:hypothetical protein TCON_2624 [Astathelohania contejeani]|uniref:Uncharacterized protein n=1 Tax=Astathelohania contejeani TaxID=164912 RepID=A0ABQ7HVH0_9MICR|nr:hypothetical protein TCON_2624 [Thelohania contejeani]
MYYLLQILFISSAYGAIAKPVSSSHEISNCENLITELDAIRTELSSLKSNEYNVKITQHLRFIISKLDVLNIKHFIIPDKLQYNSISFDKYDEYSALLKTANLIISKFIHSNELKNDIIKLFDIIMLLTNSNDPLFINLLLHTLTTIYETLKNKEMINEFKKMFEPVLLIMANSNDVKLEKFCYSKLHDNYDLLNNESSLAASEIILNMKRGYIYDDKYIIKIESKLLSFYILSQIISLKEITYYEEKDFLNKLLIFYFKIKHNFYIWGEIIIKIIKNFYTESYCESINKHLYMNSLDKFTNFMVTLKINSFVQTEKHNQEFYRILFNIIEFALANKIIDDVNEFHSLITSIINYEKYDHKVVQTWGSFIKSLEKNEHDNMWNGLDVILLKTLNSELKNLAEKLEKAHMKHLENNTAEFLEECKIIQNITCNVLHEIVLLQHFKRLSYNIIISWPNMKKFSYKILAYCHYNLKSAVILPFLMYILLNEYKLKMLNDPSIDMLNNTDFNGKYERPNDVLNALNEMIKDFKKKIDDMELTVVNQNVRKIGIICSKLEFMFDVKKLNYETKIILFHRINIKIIRNRQTLALNLNDFENFEEIVARMNEKNNFVFDSITFNKKLYECDSWYDFIFSIISSKYPNLFYIDEIYGNEPKINNEDNSLKKILEFLGIIMGNCILDRSKTQSKFSTNFLNSIIHIADIPSRNINTNSITTDGLANPENSSSSQIENSDTLRQLNFGNEDIIDSLLQYANCFYKGMNLVIDTKLLSYFSTDELSHLFNGNFEMAI